MHEFGDRSCVFEGGVIHPCGLSLLLQALLTGTRDEFYTPERVRDYERQLKTRARSVTLRSYDAAHEIVPEMRSDVVQWSTNCLRQ